jgi:cobalamin synthase
LERGIFILFKRNDWIFGLISLALGAATLYFARDVALVQSLDPAGPAAMPTIIAWIMVAIGAVHIWGAWNIIKKNPSAAEVEENSGMSRIVIICVACLVYYFFLDDIGYIVMTPLLMIVVMASVGSRDVKKILGMSLGTTAVLFCIFYFLLKVNMPLGILQPFFN